MQRPKEGIIVDFAVSKTDTDVAHYNFDEDQPILIMFARDVAETVCSWMSVANKQCKCE